MYLSLRGQMSGKKLMLPLFKIENFRSFFLSFTVLAVLLSLSGCGFKLRGQISGDLKAKQVIVDAVNYYHPVATELRRRLQILGAELKKLPDSESAITLKNDKVLYVYLNEPQQTRRTLSVDIDGRPLEYELALEVDARITTLGQDLSSIQPVTIRVRRVLVYDKDQVLAKSREREQIVVEMTQSLIDQISERLRIYASSHKI